MKIALINGSPKSKNSGSAYLLEELKVLLGHAETEVYHFKTAKIDEKSIEQLLTCDKLVFAFPLYVDGIPSQVLSCLYSIEAYKIRNKLTSHATTYALVNSGFYEGHQNALALEMMKNWCIKTNINWGQGVGIGGGGMLAYLKNVPNGKGPKKNLSATLTTLSKNILDEIVAEDLFISPNFPRLAYKLSAQMGWRQGIKKNGLKRKDLSMKK